MTTETEIAAIVRDMGFAHHAMSAGAPFPFCTKCMRHVGTKEIERGIDLWDDWTGHRAALHTGEIIVTIKCHGETYKRSNYRGDMTGSGPTHFDGIISK